MRVFYSQEKHIKWEDTNIEAYSEEDTCNGFAIEDIVKIRRIDVVIANHLESSYGTRRSK